ncbi:exonuclease 1 isoform X2 [Carica papaya]|nr:exonuclease 1 isoform X2 [Carica papaya]
MELCMDSNSEKKLRYIDYFMHRINLLRHYKIIPVVVFDGGNIPCKAATEHERHRRRTANRELAMAKLSEGNVSAASELFQRAISVTPAMAHQLIQTLKAEDIEFVVAPYEADAQLAYLTRLEVEKGGIVAVITEDSDLLAYGCQAIVFKMDRYGNGEEIGLDNVLKSAAHNPSFQKFDKELLTGMCVLAGCDFLPSVPGIGIVKAYSLVAKYRNLDRVLSVLKLEKGNQMPEDYAKSFREAFAVFQHARIYDAYAKKLEHINPLPQELLESLDGELDFLGPDLPPSVATAIAEGKLNPTSMEAFNVSQPLSLAGSTKRKLPLYPPSNQENSFLVFPSHKTRERDSTESYRIKEDPVLTKTKYLKEDSGFNKLISPADTHQAMEASEIPHDIQLKVPNNNPFKKRKLDEIRLKQTNDEGEEMSVVTENSKMDVFCSPPEDTLKFSCNNSFQNEKENEIHFNQTDCVNEKISVVTEVESSDILFVNWGSQESVNSKSRKVSSWKARGKSEKLKSICKNSERRNGSILNFFSRV